MSMLLEYGRYSLPIVLYDRTPQGKCEPTPEQAEFVKVFKNIIERCKEWLVENGSKIDRYGLEMVELKKFESVLYFKKEAGGNTLRVVENSSPTLYRQIHWIL